MSSIRLQPSSRVHWLAALSLSIACADDGTAVTSDTDTDAESSSSDGGTVTVTATVTVTGADTSSSSGPSTTVEPTESSSDEASTTVDPSTSETTAGDPCGDGEIDDRETCDGDALGGATCESQGFGGGTLACAADCMGFDTAMCDACGNDVLDDGEDCDGADLGVDTCMSLGFDEGDIACAADCTYDTTACVDFSCGDGTVNDDNEECDGDDVPVDCAGLGFGAGTVTCTPRCTLDTTACCGDGSVGGAEICDGADLDGQTCASQPGFDDGTLACNADCGGFDVSACTSCGDGAIEGDEECEGADLGGNDCTSIGAGFVAGTLACNASCGFDTSACNFCGNDTLNAGEDCDGTALGLSDCLDLGFTGGTIGCFESCTYDTELCTNFPLPGIGDVVITEIMRNPTSIPDATGEWFEVVNTSMTDTFQLQGCTFQDDDGDEFAVNVDLTIGPGELVTFANSANPGFTPDFVYAGMNLANGADELELVCDAVSVDRVAYDDPAMMGTFPGLAARAMQLDPGSIDAIANDTGSNWCAAFTPYFMTDAGTPGTANDSCTPEEFTIDFCRLQFPTTIDDVAGTAIDVFGRVYIAGQTDLSGVNDPAPAIVGYVGYGPDGTDPAANAMWVWTQASPNGGYGPASPSYEMNNDEYVATMTLPAAGTYDFAYRFSGDGGDTFTYCDGGNGSSDGYAAGDAGQLTTTAAGGDPGVLYFSEYHEGPGALNYRGLEIHNPSDEAVDLTGCTVVQYFNGNVMPGTSFALAGSVAAGDVYTLCHSSFNVVVPGGCDQVGGVQFSGDDAVELTCGGTTNDVIGQIGVDPGTEWAANGVSTLDSDLRRDCAFQDGDPDGSDAFDPSTEWDSFALGGMGHTADDFGQHVCP